MEKYKIEKDSVQETLLIPLYARKAASERYPDLIQDPSAQRILERIDAEALSSVDDDSMMVAYGSLEAAQRVYDLTVEVREYLEKHPDATVVNMGSGLDDLFSRVDNGRCKGLNIDFPETIKVRDALLPAQGREENLAADLNDYAWMDKVDGSKGAVFAASGVLYYFTREEALALIKALSERFPGGMLVFDSTNSLGLKMMLKTAVKKAEIKDVKAYFSLSDPVKELSSLSPSVSSVSYKRYMTGYRKLKGIGALFHILDWVADHVVKMNIVRVCFKEK